MSRRSTKSRITRIRRLNGPGAGGIAPLHAVNLVSCAPKLSLISLTILREQRDGLLDPPDVTPYASADGCRGHGSSGRMRVSPLLSSLPAFPALCIVRPILSALRRDTS